MQITKEKITTKDMVETSLLIALVLLSTWFINVKLPILSSGGLVHFGTVMLFIAAIVFGKKKGAIAGGIGMGLFDFISGWTLWAPFTLVVRYVMGYILGAVAYSKNAEGKSIVRNILGGVLAGIWMIFGYYVAEVIIYGNVVAPIASIPGNLAQLFLAFILGIPISNIIKKYV